MTEDRTGPGATALDDAGASEVLASRRFGVLATTKRSGHPHLTTMLYHWKPEERLLRFSTTLDRVKVKHVRNSGKAALHVSVDDWTFAVAEGDAEVSEVSSTPGDAVGRELLEMLPEDLRADPDSSDEDFLRLQVDERRVVIRLKVTKLYGTRISFG
ncbi:PPOX class probable F420-dependent enzyme [Saccharothrix tamanrassetensis]|uniref:PPOX class probable F420-dependent enzyme n=1 Tax=Saccharothrix tamanrassetensis TaxID=1051531 RepID=A0A841CBE2_9PSEU|nr:TIGR03618 family F420-dependent PPOX class oxidoreductase [Saccharothrix tamanrassetensis]MBB5954300.1 PPOX class probable F420-dependent enzyme [Saccharothrix tamanrassetensis]